MILKKFFRWLLGSAESTEVQLQVSEPGAQPESDPPISKEDLANFQRSVRRLALKMEEHGEVAQRIDVQIESLQRIANCQESNWLPILDRLYELYQALLKSQLDLAQPLLATIEGMEELLRLTPLAIFEEEVDPLDCQVVSTIPVEREQHGLVQLVVRQGYRRSDGSLVREAVVILGRCENRGRDTGIVNGNEDGFSSQLGDPTISLSVSDDPISNNEQDQFEFAKVALLD